MTTNTTKAVTNFGDGTNQASFAADGELTFAGTGRVTKELIFYATALGKGGTAPTESIVDNFNIESYTIGDDSVVKFEMPSDWATGTDLTVGLHWACNEAYVTASGEVQWQVTWRAVKTGEAYDSAGASGTIEHEDINIHATARALVETDLGIIAGASLEAGDVVGMTLSRVALDAGTDPTAEAEVLLMEVKYIADKLGTAT